MKAKIYEKKVSSHVYLLDEGHMGTGYLVVGSNKAVLIDTMNARVNLKKYIKKHITDLPVTVINTHGHCDHIFGNAFFGEAYLNPLDNELAYEMTAKNFGYRLLLLARGLKLPVYKPITYVTAMLRMSKTSPCSLK